MSEEIVSFGTNRSLVGILHRPEADAGAPDLPTVVMLNAGILHRVGPNRLYVKIARQLAQAGFRVLRFDVWGIGDSQDQNGVSERRTFIDDTRDAFDMLGEREGVNSFILMGICMGARIALDVATIDKRVESLVLMEGIYIKSARYHISRMLEPQKWVRLFTGQSNMVKKLRGVVARRLTGSNGNHPPAPLASKAKTVAFLEEKPSQNIKNKLSALLGRGAKIMLIFRDGNEIAYNYRLQKNGDDISAMGLPTGLDVAFIRFADHTFTPLISQDLLLKVTMGWIGRNHLGQPQLS